MKRDYGFDNIKCILIFFVVLGHLLEFCNCFARDTLYRLIYQFHMPVFVFISGYFGRFGKKPILEKVWLYGLFQTLYILFERYVLGGSSAFSFATPYWILWYMLAMIFYSVLIPLYQKATGKKRALALCVVLLFALLAGFCKRIGYVLTLSRFFVFQPYFLLGLYYKDAEQRIQNSISGMATYKKRIFVCVLVFFGVLTVFRVFHPAVTKELLYGSYAYTSVGDMFLRGMQYIVSLVWIGMFLAAKPFLKRRIPVVSEIGKHTLCVYLLHGFFMRAGQRGLFPHPDNLALLFLCSALYVCLLGNRYTATVFQWLIPTRWCKRQ